MRTGPSDELIRAHLDADERGYRRTLYCRVVEALRADGLQQLTTEYPVLRRHLSATVASWLALSRELLLRVHRDHDILTEKFDLPLNARLIGVKTGISDPHRGGRSVAILTFATASAKQVSIVYKPRDLRVDAAFHQLICEVSATTPDSSRSTRLNGPAPRRLRVRRVGRDTKSAPATKSWRTSTVTPVGSPPFSTCWGATTATTRM